MRCVEPPGRRPSLISPKRGIEYISHPRGRRMRSVRSTYFDTAMRINSPLLLYSCKRKGRWLSGDIQVYTTWCVPGHGYPTNRTPRNHWRISDNSTSRQRGAGQTSINKKYKTRNQVFFFRKQIPLLWFVCLSFWPCYKIHVAKVWRHDLPFRRAPSTTCVPGTICVRTHAPWPCPRPYHVFVDICAGSGGCDTICLSV